MYAGLKNLRAARRWKKTATNFTDLTGLMVLWLEGKIHTWPGHLGPPDPETDDLFPTLIAANRAGFLTTDSQPGFDPQTGHGDRTWEQRAAVQGWVRTDTVLARLVDAAQEAGLVVATWRLDTRSRGGLPVTRVDGEYCTWFGKSPTAASLAWDWAGISREALADLAAGQQVMLAAPEFGTDADWRVWDALETFAGRVPA